MRPLLSIIVPVHNGEEYLNQCFQSIVEQELEDIEIIAVDDGSSDNSWKIMKKWAAEDSRFRLARNIRPSGNPGTPRNQAIKAAKGAYIGFVDCDDWIESDYYSNFELPRSENVDIFQSIGFHNHVGSRHSRLIYPHPLEAHKLFKKYIYGDAIWDKVYRREMLLGNRIFLAVRKASVDVPFVAKAAFHQRSSQIVPQTGYHYRRGVKGSTISLRETSNCDFVIQSYVDILNWAGKVGIDPCFRHLLHMKMAMNLIYTLKVVNQKFYQEFYYQCRRLLSRVDLQEIAEAEACVGFNYLRFSISDILNLTPFQYAERRGRDMRFGMSEK